MALIIVGGNSRNVGKTSVVANLVRALPGRRWLAMKITQYGHGICSAKGEPCDCASASHTAAVTVERDAESGTDTSRFLAAGAERVLWVRTEQGHLAEAMPRVRKELASAENVIVESNSLVRFVQPDLYLAVLDPAVADFKPSAQLFLDRADAFLISSDAPLGSKWPGVPRSLLSRTPKFRVSPPSYLSDEVIALVSTVAAEKHL